MQEITESKLMYPLWGLGCLAVLSLVLAQLAAGIVGIEHHLGWFAGAFAFFLFFFFRFTLPITIGSFFGAKDVWGWEWYWALALASPTLVLVVPGVLTAIIATISSRLRVRSECAP
jgi:hypothetical protein